MFPSRKRIPHPFVGTRLAEEVPGGELRRLDRIGTVVTLHSPTSLIRQSALGRQCVVVIDGVLRVERDGDLVAELGAGDVAGEMAMLTGRPCNATVVAEPGTSLYAMNRRELATLLDDCPTLSNQVWRTAIDRLPVSA